MSILSCLGQEAEAIRDIYLARMQAKTEVHKSLLSILICNIIKSKVKKNYPIQIYSKGL